MFFYLDLINSEVEHIAHTQLAFYAFLESQSHFGIWTGLF